MSTYCKLANQRALLRQQYRAAIEQHRQATSPERQAHWAAQAALAITELQHPDLQDLEERFAAELGPHET